MKLCSVLGGLPCLALFASRVTALVGFEDHPYDPLCAYTCYRTLATFMLSCSDMDMGHGGHSMHGGGPTSPECRAGDSAYLTSTAWCMSTKCAEFNLPVSHLEKFWEGFVTENPALPAKWTYVEALANVSEPPTRELQPDDMLDVPSLVPDAAFWAQFNTLGNVVRESYVEAQYGVAILVIGFALPVVLTWLGYLPGVSGVFLKPVRLKALRRSKAGILR